MTTFYVDAKGGNDSNSGTSEARAWATLVHASRQVSAGDTVIVLEGEYDEAVTIRTSGSSGKEITWRAREGDTVRVGSFHLTDKSYNVFDGFEHINAYQSRNAVYEIKNNSHYNTIRNCTIHDLDTSVVYAIWIHGGVSTGNVLEYNTIYNMKAPARTDHFAIMLSRDHDTTVRFNTMYNIEGDCIQLYPSDSLYDKGNCQILYNHMYVEVAWQAGCENAIDIKQATQGAGGDVVLIKGNVIHGFRPNDPDVGGSGGGGGAAVCVHYQYSDNIHFEHNYIYDCQRGIWFSKSYTYKGIRIHNNIFSKIDDYDAGKSTYALLFVGSFPDLTIDHNTFLDCDHWMVEGARMAGSILRNNLFYRAGQVTGTVGTYDHNGWFSTPGVLSGRGDVTGTDPGLEPLTWLLLGTQHSVNAKLPSGPSLLGAGSPLPGITDDFLQEIRGRLADKVDGEPQADTHTYYVDATSGNDGNSGTSADQAWKTLAKVNSGLESGLFKAGDSIRFKRGETWNITSYADNLWLRHVSGTPDSYITFGAYGAGDDPVFDAGGHAVVGIYSVESDVVSYFNIENIEIQNLDAQGIWLRGAHHFKIDNVTIHDTISPEGLRSGIYFNHNTQHWTVQNCAFYNLHGEGLHIATDDGSDRSGYGTIDQVTIYNCDREGIDLKPGSRNVTITNCSIWKTTTLRGNGCIVVGGSGHIIRHNRLEYSKKGRYEHHGINLNYYRVDGEGANNITIEYNKINRCYDNGISCVGTARQRCSNITIRDNDIVNCGNAIQLQYVDGITITHNSFNACARGLHTDNAIPGTDFTSDHNYYGNNLGTDCNLDGYGGDQTFAEVYSAHNIENNSVRGISGRSAVDDETNLVNWWPVEEESGAREVTAGVMQAGPGITGEFSLIAWVKRDHAANQVITGKWDSDDGNRSYGIEVTSANKVRGYISTNGSDTSYVEGDIALSTATWYHVAFVYDGRELSLYIDGKLDRGPSNPIEYSSGVHDGGTDFALERWSDGSHYFDRHLVNVMAFERGLTAWEIAELYEVNLLDTLPPVTSEAGVMANVSRAAANTTTGNQSFFIDLGNRSPKLVFFTISRAIADGTARDHAIIGYGATDGTNQWACSVSSQHNQGQTVDRRRGMTDKCLCIINPANGSVDGEASFVSFTPDTVTVNWTNAPSAAYLVQVFAMGGDGLTAHANTFTPPSTVNKATTIRDVGFEFEGMITASHLETFTDRAQTSLHLSLGFVTNQARLKQCCYSLREANGHTYGYPSGRITRSYTVMQVESDGSIQWAGEIGNVGPDGFDCTSRVDGSGGDQVGFICWTTGGQASCDSGTFTTPSSPGSKTVSGIGFTPQAAILGMTMLPELNTAYGSDPHAGSMGFGVMTGSDVYATSIQLEDGLTTSDTQSFSDDALTLPQDDGTRGYQAGLPTFNSDGWDQAFSASPWSAQTMYLAIEEAKTAG